MKMARGDQYLGYGKLFDGNITIDVLYLKDFYAALGTKAITAKKLSPYSKITAQLIHGTCF